MGQVGKEEGRKKWKENKNGIDKKRCKKGRKDKRNEGKKREFEDTTDEKIALRE